MTQWILDTIAAGGYWGIFFLMTVENIFPPIPSELIMGMGGINVASGQMSFIPLLVAGSLGSTLGNYIWYMAGRKMGYERLRPFIDRWGRWLTLDWHDVEDMIAFFQRHGHWIVFVLRFSPLLRTMISLPAGLARMNRVRFLVYTLAGTTIWNILLIGAGIFLGTRFQEEVDKFVGPLAILTIVAVVGAYAWRVIRWRPRT
ncbi:DedA family protein [Sphingomonas lacunae]|uniref:DedA family protein n=1 Tax=Sphingomonas lacunae TaxID=2698828 RepID=A0A6M4ATI7_9SPHN|nr:DedA family protein [Sphingomonas lacunae]QJQ32417.1 DedA family protein [Sphingomonas lacunae]